MRYLILYIFITLSCFGANRNSIETLDKLINDISQINQQIFSIKKQNLDTNSSSSFQNKKFKLIEKKRDYIISKIPPLIVIKDKNIQPIIENINRRIDTLMQKIEINQKYNYQNAVTRDIISSTTLHARKDFFEAIMRINNISDNKFDTNFNDILDETELSLKSHILPNLPNTLSTSNKDYPFNELQNDQINAQATLDAYLQIINYLNLNVNLLKSNYFISVLDIDGLVNFINDKINFQNSYINVGKLVICASILLVLICIRLLLKKRQFVIFVINFKRTNYTPEEKAQIVNATNKPLLAFIFLFGLKLCVNILYHPYAVSSWIATAFSISYIVVLTWLVLGVTNCYGFIALNSFTMHNNTSMRKEVGNLLLKFIYFIILTVSILLILSTLGVNISAIIASFGIGGLAVAWASKDVLANFFASILLLIDNSFSQGDWIVCGSVEGTVVEIGLRRTTIRAFDNSLLFVPNSILANDPIRNWSKRKVGRRIKMDIGLSYSSDPKALEKTVNEIREMLINNPKIANPKNISKFSHRYTFKENMVSLADLEGYKNTLLVYLDELAGSSINIMVYCFSQTVEWEKWLQTKQEVIFSIMDIVEKNGLSFAFPSQSIYIESLPKNQIASMLLDQDDGLENPIKQKENA